MNYGWHTPGMRAVLVLAALAAGCVYRPPPNRAQAQALADNLLMQNELEWGSVLRVWEPGPGDASGRLFWQVDYQGPPAWLERQRPPRPCVLVDARTGWARFPDEGYRYRSEAQETAPPAAQARVEPGTWILVLTEGRSEDLGPRAEALNRDAGRDGLAPLFGLRASRRGGGTPQLIFGWQEDHGMVRDQAVVDWLGRKGIGVLGWVDLAAGR